MMKIRERLRVYADRILGYLLYTLIALWVISLIASPLGIIVAFIEGNPLGLGIFLALTMWIYWITGVLIAIAKGWRFDK